MVLKHETKTLGHAVVFLLVMLACPATSRDFGILTRMLYAAFLAEQGVALCTVADPAFASETSGRWDTCATTRSTPKRRSRLA